MGLLTKEQILSADDLKTEDVSVEEWGGSVRVRTMTGLERDSFGASITTADGKVDTEHFRIALVAATVVDESGARMFGKEDIAALGGKSAAALQRVYEVAERLNGIGAKAVEQAVKNSEAAQSGDSPSA